MSKFNIFYSPQSVVANVILADPNATGYLSIKSLQRNFFCISLRKERIEKSRWAAEMMTKRCNKIGFNAMNNVAMSAFCAISGGGGGTSKPRSLTRRSSFQIEPFAASFGKEGGVIRLYSSMAPIRGDRPHGRRGDRPHGSPRLAGDRPHGRFRSPNRPPLVPAPCACAVARPH